MASKAKVFAVAMAGLTASITVGIAVSLKEELYEWLYPIPVVRTWGELLAQRPIHLGNGVTVRVGIESTRCPALSGVLIYCLAEGYDPHASSPLEDSHHRTLTEDSLGPLQVSVVEEGPRLDGQPLQKEAVGIFGGPSRVGTEAKRLFARSIPVPRPGKYHVSLLEGDRPLRFVTLEGTGESIHPWVTLRRSSKPATRLWRGRGAFLGTFVPLGGPAAIPSWRGFMPYPHADTLRALADPACPLPRLMPEVATQPEMDLRMIGDTAILRPRSKIVSDESHFLARWWVNGMPHVPRRNASLEMMRDGSEMHSGTIRFELDFDSHDLEVRTGDRITLQLLYLDRGWTFIGGHESLFSNQEEQRVYQSNRVELTVP